MAEEENHWYPVGRAVVMGVAAMAVGFILVLLATAGLLGPPEEFAGSSLWRAVLWHFFIFQLPLLVGGILAAGAARLFLGTRSRFAGWILIGVYGLVLLVFLVPFFLAPAPNLAINGPIQLLIFAGVALAMRFTLMPRRDRTDPRHDA